MQGWRAEVVAIALGLVFWAGLAVWLVPGPPAALAACRAAPSAGCLGDLALDRLRREPGGYFDTEIKYLGQLGRVEDALPVARRAVDYRIHEGEFAADTRDSDVAATLAPYRLVADLRAGADVEAAMAGLDGFALNTAAWAILDSVAQPWADAGQPDLEDRDRAIVAALAARMVVLDQGAGEAQGAFLTSTVNIHAALGARDRLIEALALIGRDTQDEWTVDEPAFRLAGTAPVMAALRRMVQPYLVWELRAAAIVAVRHEADPGAADAYLREAFAVAGPKAGVFDTEAEYDFETQRDVVDQAVQLGRLEVATELVAQMERIVDSVPLESWTADHIPVQITVAEALWRVGAAPDRVRARLAIAEGMMPAPIAELMPGLQEGWLSDWSRRRIDRILAEIGDPKAQARVAERPESLETQASEALESVSADPSPARCGPALQVAGQVLSDRPWAASFAAAFDARRIAQWCGAPELAEAALARLTRRALRDGSGADLLAAALEWQRLGRLR